MSVAIITGASEGLGRAIALDLAADGWDVVIDARRSEPLDAVVSSARRHGGRVVAIRGDIADATHRESLVDAARAIGRLDLVIANAGALGPSPLPRLADLSLDDLEAILRVNVVAQLGLAQHVLPLLTASRGVFVAITSDAAVEGYEGWGGYGASKAALEQLANVLAAEHPDVPIYRFDPGDMRTRMHQDAFPGEDISDRPLPESVVPAIRALLRERPPSGRFRAADVLSPAR
jgi:NAD(P)-dependent dehydrogenase (short-subunit alcohol dehydrogenase family)